MSTSVFIALTSSLTVIIPAVLAFVIQWRSLSKKLDSIHGLVNANHQAALAEITRVVALNPNAIQMTPMPPVSMEPKQSIDQPHQV